MRVKRLQMRVRGRVQGVGFRYSCLRQARALGVTGRVRNCADGSVEIVVEGEASAVDALADWARRGPTVALVSDVQLNETPSRGEFLDFTVSA